MKYDCVIFGASGFTGQFVVQHLARALQRDKDAECTWAVAGRSEQKLNKVLAEATKETGIDLARIPLIICDTDDAESIGNMASKARVVLNCVGPYRFHGEKTVAACVKAGASHLDISGETQFIETMQLKYDEEARANGCYVISTCGFDCIPNDVGSMFLAKKMEGDVNSVESYLTVSLPVLNFETKCNYGTWHSLLYMIHNISELKEIRRQLFPTPLPEMAPKLNRKWPLSWCEQAQSYAVPFIGSPDVDVMVRTQRLKHERDNERPAQVQAYVTVPGFIIGALLPVVMFFPVLILGAILQTKLGLYLLEHYPRLCTFGSVSKDGPSREMAENSHFVFTQVGKGWKNKAASHDVPPTREVVVKVSGKNMGYGTTCECIVQAAIVMVKEKDRLPKDGGVYTPGYAFANTSIVERLNAGGVPFVATVKDL